MNAQPEWLSKEPVGIDRLFVTVGTDFHNFDRLIWWLDEWLSTNPQVGETFVQRGTSALPDNAESIEYLKRSELTEHFEQASVVVCHGGPATILECRAAGIVPIVVPREERFGEHVNDHQVDFCDRVAAHGEILLARTKDEFFRILELATLHGVSTQVEEDGHQAAALGKFEDRMVDLLGPRARSLPIRTPDLSTVDAPVPQVPVLFIGAVPRSGSSVISDLLNQHPHLANIGELVHIWERGVGENNLCGCGEPFASCAFWTEVGDIAFGGWDQLSSARMRSLQLLADRTRHIPSLLRSPGNRSVASRRYGSIIAKLLHAIQEVSGAPMIVDTSKHVSTALLLRQIPEVDLRVLHLVRDPRGVAHSWTKRVARTEVLGSSKEMDRLHPGRIGLRWVWFNWAFVNMSRLGVPVATVRYEDFVDDPESVLDQIFYASGVETLARPLFAEGMGSYEGHTVSGNPKRLASGPIEIRSDEAWKNDMPPQMVKLVSSITRPWLRRFNYPEDVS